MNKEDFITYIKSDPKRLDAYRAKPENERKALYSKYVTSGSEIKAETKVRPLYERKSVEQMTGAGMNPYLAAAAATAQEAAPAGYQFLNQLTGGLATPALKQYNITPPQAETGAGKALEALGTGAGFALGAPVRAGGLVAKGIGGVGVVPSMARGAAQFGTAGLLQTPDGGIDDTKARLMQGGAGVAGGAVIGAAQRGLENMMKLGAKEAPALAQKVRKEYSIFRKRLSRDFGKGLEEIATNNPGKKVDFSKPMSNFVKEIDSSKKVKNFINRLSDNSKKWFIDAQKGKFQRRLTPQESQELYNDIKSTASSKQITGEVLPNERAITRLLREMNATRERTFKGMRELNRKYAKAMEADDMIGKYMDPGKTLSASKIDDPEVKAAMRFVFPKETLGELSGYGVAKNVANFVPGVIGSAARIGILGAGLGAGLSRLKRGGE